MTCFVQKAHSETRPLFAVVKDDYDIWLSAQTEAARAWLAGTGFKATAGSISAFPVCAPSSSANIGSKGTGSIGMAFVLILKDSADFWSWGSAARSLPEGCYDIHANLSDLGGAEAACLGWGLGSYQFDRYKPRKDAVRQLVWPDGVDQRRVRALVDAITLTRDLINIPASDMGPAELAAAAKAVAEEFGGRYSEIVGEDLLTENFPMIHAVGRASDRAPRLIDIGWGDESAPKVTLIGKGVCFDTGGLDLKPSQFMLMMKKDMGGAANALGLARMIMAVGLKVQLRLLIPAVENSVSGNAFRPLDVLDSRQGITVEVGNTDAEGRLVLGDALTYAGEDKPDLILDFATLTGAARVALGTDLPALFCNDDTLAKDLQRAAKSVSDPTWRLPLYRPYAQMLDSKVADTNNVSSGGFAGAITAALFLEKFVPEETAWAHFDMMAWNTAAKPGRPEGGEAMAIRSVFEMLTTRYG